MPSSVPHRDLMLAASASKPFSRPGWFFASLEDCHHVRYLQHVQEYGEARYRHFQQLGLEGIMAKKAEVPCKTGSSQVWKKVKTPAFRQVEANRLKRLRGQ